MMTHFFSRFALVLSAALAGVFMLPASATTMQLSSRGMGQALLFPYYTARNNTVSFLSLVNATTSAKAVRINMREARGGFVVAQINVYLSAKDVWTAAVANDADGASIFSNDTSCTAPAIGSGLALSNALYRADLPLIGADLATLGSRDRTREGYIEIIEMVSIPNVTLTGRDVTHVAGKPACRSGISDVTFEPPVEQLAAPSGGLYGTLSLVNVDQGMLVSTPATAIENFWLSGTGAPTPRVTAANATLDLTAGKNTGVSLQVRGEQYAARFANSIDAVSALFMSASANSEYATTNDRVIGTTMVATMPTKPYYTRGTVLGPFATAWAPNLGIACDPFYSAAVDREEFISFGYDGGIYIPPPRGPGNCYVANTFVPIDGNGDVASRPVADRSYLGSLLAVSFPSSQNQGVDVSQPGKEGGWAALTWTGKLSAIDASVMRRNAAGALVAAPVSITLNGLPVLGFTLAQSAYKTGSPQQNYADATPLRTSVTVTETP
jgi:hypothetical protein